MLVRYQVDGVKYLQIKNFAKHQNPHRDEQASTIPAQGSGSKNEAPDEPIPNASTMQTQGSSGNNEAQPEPIHHASTVQAPCNHDASTMLPRLTPDSCILTPDSQTPTSNIEEVGKVLGQALPDKKPRPAKKRRPQTEFPPDFYPDATGLDKASASGLSVAVQLEKFKDFHQSKGSLMADWQAGWRTWCRNAVDFASRNPARSATAETAYQRSQRERVASFAPDLARRVAPNSNVQPLHPEYSHAVILARH
jgi:hypothetical protein